MKFNALPLAGAFEIGLDPIGDERGMFARAYCQREFAANGLQASFVQANISVNRTKWTLRGLHYQRGDHAEAKVLRVTKGAIFDVLVDVRRDSPTFLQHVTLRIDADKKNALFIPKGFANGIMTMEDNTELFYLMSDFYSPAEERGLRWNDPQLAIAWPAEPAVISDKDRDHPDFDPDYHL